MKTIYLIILLLINISAIQAGKIEISKIIWNGKEVEVVKDRILVKLKANYNKENLSERISNTDLIIDQDPDILNIASLKTPDSVKSITEYIDQLKQMDIFDHVGPDMIHHMLVTPSDTYYEDQWALPKVNAPDGWDITTGDGDILIGVLDSGIPMQSGSLSHEDLDNTSIITLGIDCVQDGNGVMDENGHGTHVAGIINAESNNSTGITGTSWNCKLKIYQVFDEEGHTSESIIKDAVLAAIGGDPICKIINYSGGGPDDFYLEQAVDAAYDEGVIFVAAAGNYHWLYNPYREVEYPAAYSDEYDNVIAVSATTSGDALAGFSAYGPKIVVSAPGDDIYSTTPNYDVYHPYEEDYDYDSGTSMAAPLVAGQAALIWSQYPSMDYSEVIDQIKRTAEDLGTEGFDNSFGYGRVDVGKSLLNIYVPDQFSTIASALSAAESGQTVIVSSGSHTVSSDLTVSSGVTLQIEPGATLEFDDDTQLAIYATLIAEGTSVNMITFDKSGASDWGGIRFLDSSDDSECSLSYCTIDNVSSYGVYCSRSNPTITNCTIKNATCGIYLYYPDASTDKVKYNVISDNSYGIFQYNGDSQTYGNDISDCSKGIYIISGDLKIQADTISYNSTEGIRFDGSDAILIKNMIYKNDGDGIYCLSYSDPLIVSHKI